MMGKEERLFSLPGVVGFGYGKREVKGQPTENEALIVFVEKKRPSEELTDEELVPLWIENTPTDVIEIGKVMALSSDYEPNDKAGILCRYYKATSDLTFHSTRLAAFQQLLKLLQDDMEKVTWIKDLLGELNWKNYQKDGNKTRAPMQILLQMIQDLENLAIIRKIVGEIHLDEYRHVLQRAAEEKQLLPWRSIQGWLRRLVRIFFSREKIDRTTFVRPAQPGVSIGHEQGSAGTFGAVVYDRLQRQPLILSNNHVMANASRTDAPRARLGDSILQPGKAEPGASPIGKLARFIPLDADQNNIVDCAVAEPLQAAWVSAEILEIGTVRGMTEPIIGMQVQKSGRTTGLTRGVIRAVGATIRVNYGEEVLTFQDQIVATGMSEPGDSGSLVLSMENEAIGLLFAGSAQSTILNPIEPVLDLLKVRLTKEE